MKCTCHIEKSWCEVHMSTKAKPGECLCCKKRHEEMMQSTSQSLSEAFDKAGIPGTKTYLIKEQIKRFNKGSKDLQKFLKEQEKQKKEFEKWLKKNPISFKSATLTGQTPVKTNLGVAVKCVNPININGLINSKLKNVTKRKLLNNGR